MVYQITSSINWFSEKNAPSEEINFTDEENSSDLEDFSLNSNELIEQTQTLRTESNFCFSDMKKKGNLVEQKVFQVFLYLDDGIDIAIDNYSKIFFACQFFKNPSLKKDKKNWGAVFNLIENRIINVYKEVLNCVRPIGAGYATDYFPKFCVKKFLHPDPIYFGKEILKSTNSEEYVCQLGNVAFSKIPNLIKMMENTSDLIDKLKAYDRKEISGQISEELEHFILNKINKIKDNVLDGNKQVDIQISEIYKFFKTKTPT